MTKHKMSNKEYQTWQEWLKEAQDAGKLAAKPAPAVRPAIWWALLIVTAALLAAVGWRVGRPHNAILYVVATPTTGPDYHIRFLCYTNGRQLLPRMSVTWIRENGQTVTDATDGTGCTMIPANEPVGVFDHVRQVTYWVWPGSLPVCVDIAGGGTYSGNLCPPGY